MLAFLSDYFRANGINLFAPIPLSACKLNRPYLLERAEISPTCGTAIMLAVPYYTRAATTAERNLSAYAVPRDYHVFFRDLYNDLLPRLRERFPNERFAGFSDHSPIDEREAAARAGLGIYGKNGMLITEPYSSFVFLGEVITSASLPAELHEIRTCENCGACRRACPMNEIGTCLSALTQKKGNLTEQEIADLRKYGSVWGCDLCGEVCPHTQRALRNGTIYSEIPFFNEETISHLTLQDLDGMSEQAFAERAFAWRGRDTIRRNLILFEKSTESFKPSDQLEKRRTPC